jgi:hypothetical protein
MKDGKPVFMLERHQIEGRTADDIARDLTSAFDRYCATAGAASEHNDATATDENAALIGAAFFCLCLPLSCVAVMRRNFAPLGTHAAKAFAT